MKSSISIIAIVMWLGLSSSVVNALSPGSIDSDFAEFGTVAIANFGNDSVSLLPFEDHFTFNATPPVLGLGELKVTSDFSTDFSTSGGFNVHFDSLEIWDVTTPIPTLEASGRFFGDFTGKVDFTGLTSGHDYDIVVTGGLDLGEISGGYTGNITIVSAIPEPETYAMLLVGLCLVSFVARGRRRTAADYL